MIKCMQKIESLVRYEDDKKLIQKIITLMLNNYSCYEAVSAMETQQEEVFGKIRFVKSANPQIKFKIHGHELSCYNFVVENEHDFWKSLDAYLTLFSEKGITVSINGKQNTYGKSYVEEKLHKFSESHCYEIVREKILDKELLEELGSM